MSKPDHVHAAQKVARCITVSQEGAYSLVLCPRELVHRFIAHAERELAPDQHFLAMGETPDDAILQTSAPEEVIARLSHDFVTSLTDEQLQTFLERHPQLGPATVHSAAVIESP